MAVVHVDGFTHMATGDPSKYRGAAPSTNIYTDGPRRSGIKSGSGGGYKYIGNLTTATVGIAFRAQATGGINPIVFLADSSTGQCCLRVNANASISFCREYNTVLETTIADLLVWGQWYYLELKVTCDQTTGAYEARLNGVAILQGTGVNTQYSVGGKLYAVTTTYMQQYTTDFYVNDGDFLGDCLVDTIMPSGAGTDTGFSPSTGANWQNVDDPGDIDNDSTYNGANLTPARDSFAFQDLPSRPTSQINAVAINLTARKDDAGSRSIRPYVILNGTRYYGTTWALTDVYVDYQHIWPISPRTSSLWTEDEVNGAEFGYDLVS